MLVIRRKLLRIVSYLLVLVFFGCATYGPHFNEEDTESEIGISSKKKPIQSLYLVGDAGGAKPGEPLTHFQSLKDKLALESSDATLIFLGDNIYQKGMPKKGDENRLLAEHRIDAQLDLFTDFKGRVIFIPGNHDYYSGGVKGVLRQAHYIEKKTGEKHLFLPENGCPIQKVELGDDLVLLVLDTQWYLENWDKVPTKNDDCEVKTREQFFEEFESLVKKNAMKTTIVALHHPLYSGGSHGGQFKFSPLRSIPNLLRKTSGASMQDQQNPFYTEFKKRLITLSQYGEKIVFVSGHEHILQYVEREDVVQIVSGSGSKTSASRHIAGSKFSMGSLGYSKLDVYENREGEVGFYKAGNKKDSLVYSKKIFDRDKKREEMDYAVEFDSIVTTSVYTKDEVSKGKAYKFIWGKHYREYYGKPIKAQVVSLDTLMGGLVPLRKGGGHQSNSLRLEDKDGKEYVMRALRKNSNKFLQSMFLDRNIEGKFDDTATEDMLLDVFTTAHPYATMVLGPMMDSLDIYHPNSSLYYVPKQPGLISYNDDFGDELYFIEERAASGHGDKKNFGYSDKIISSDDMMDNLRDSDEHYLDEEAYIRARLFDMLIGDWDRHKDQWRWAEFKEGKKRIYKPVPRDRDQAFSKYDGALMQFTTRIIPAAKKMQVYEGEFRSLKWFNANPFPVDKALINRSSLEVWLEQAEFIQENISEELIKASFSNLPLEVQDETVDELIEKMNIRLKNLKNTAKEYHDYLAKYPIVKGNDKDNYFKITRLNDGKTSVEVFNIKKDSIGTKVFEKTFSSDITKEIWFYGLDDKDIFEVKGKGQQYILLRLIGGQNQDTYKIENGRKVVVHDFKDKKNNFETKKGKIRLSNDYDINLYNFKKNKYNQNQLVPTLGFNPDDGFRLGINNVFTVFGFNRNPFSSQHSLKAHYYFATNGFDISYSYELANVLGKWNLFLATGATSPNYSINFYGFGNETINEEEEFGDNYHRVKMSAYVAYPKLKWRGRMGAEIEVGGLFEGIELENTEGRFINTLPVLLEDRQYYLGAEGKYAYENFDNNAFPTLGMSFEFEAGWKTNTSGNFDDITYMTPSLTLTHRLVSNGKLVLSSKLKGDLVWGDNFEFYNAASIGGKDGLRGYRNQRFTGNKSFYQNTDLRYNIAEFKTGLAPMQIAAFGGFDYGRVWLDGEDSNSWKTSYGGGLALVGADMINMNLSLFGSEDGMYFTFGMGFNF